MQSLVELANLDIVDHLRRKGLGMRSTSGSLTPPEEKITLPPGTDLVAYLRSEHGMLTTSEVANLLHWSPDKVRRRIKTMKFPGFWDGGRWTYDRAKVADWIEEQAREVASPTRSE